MSGYITVGGYDRKHEEGKIEYQIRDGAKIRDIEFFLPPSAFTLGVKGKNSLEKNHELAHLWDELVQYKDHSAKCEGFLEVLNQAILDWDTAKVDLLHKWYSTVANYKKPPLKSIWRLLGDDFSGMPLKGGVAVLLEALEGYILDKGKVPTKRELRSLYESADKDRDSVAEFDKVIKTAGFNWLENSTHKR